MARSPRKRGPVKLVLIANHIPEKGMFLRKYEGRKAGSEAWIEKAELASPEMTIEGLKSVIEEFRAM